MIVSCDFAKMYFVSLVMGNGRSPTTVFEIIDRQTVHWPCTNVHFK